MSIYLDVNLYGYGFLLNLVKMVYFENIQLLGHVCQIYSRQTEIAGEGDEGIKKCNGLLLTLFYPRLGSRCARQI